MSFFRWRSSLSTRSTEAILGSSKALKSLYSCRTNSSGSSSHSATSSLLKRTHGKMPPSRSCISAGLMTSYTVSLEQASARHRNARARERFGTQLPRCFAHASLRQASAVGSLYFELHSSANSSIPFTAFCTLPWRWKKRKKMWKTHFLHFAAGDVSWASRVAGWTPPSVAGSSATPKRSGIQASMLCRTCSPIAMCTAE
mmetsp:Transcript_33968/g.95510  ORF Transcript_33968/g.95510 Transcript_33968/m.95510 type:complete len:200 (-) Transcript_33968:728-1327(-)